MKRDDAEEKPEHCIECGRLRDLEGVAITLGRQTFHLFYLCNQCGNVGLKELLSIIKSHLDEDKTGDRKKREQLNHEVLPKFLFPDFQERRMLRP